MVNNGGDDLRPVGHAAQNRQVCVIYDPLDVHVERVGQIGIEMLTCLGRHLVHEGVQAAISGIDIAPGDGLLRSRELDQQAIVDAPVGEVARLIGLGQVGDDALDGGLGGDGIELIVVNGQFLGIDVDREIDLAQPAAVIAVSPTQTGSNSA